MRFPADLMEWYKNCKRFFPWRENDLTPYEAFVAEMLLRKTTAEAAESVYRQFIDQFPDLDSLERAEAEEIAQLLQPLGLHNKRAKAFKNIADQYPDGLPDTRKELLELPQVSPYIADSTLCFGYGRNQPIVDANVARIYSHLLGKDFGTGHQMYRNQELRSLVESDLPENGSRISAGRSWIPGPKSALLVLPTVKSVWQASTVRTSRKQSRISPN
jgi:A/G-specific adenine glycosylase